MHDYIQGKHEERRRRKMRRFHTAIFGGIGIVCIAGIMWFLHTDIYIMRETRIEGIDSVLQQSINSDTQQYIQNRSWFSNLLLNTKSILGFNTNSLAQAISQKYPILADVSVSKNYFTRVITVSARERTKVALWCNANITCWWFDEQGIVFLEGPSTQGQLINKIISKSSEQITLGKEIPIFGGGSLIKSIFSFLEAIGSSGKSLIWNKDLDEIQTEPQNNFPILYFSTRQDPSYALDEIKKLSNLKKLSYIDLRITNRIYYK